MARRSAAELKELRVLLRALLPDKTLEDLERILRQATPAGQPTWRFGRRGGAAEAKVDNLLKQLGLTRGKARKLLPVPKSPVSSVGDKPDFAMMGRGDQGTFPAKGVVEKMRGLDVPPPPDAGPTPASGKLTEMVLTGEKRTPEFERIRRTMKENPVAAKIFMTAQPWAHEHLPDIPRIARETAEWPVSLKTPAARGRWLLSKTLAVWVPFDKISTKDPLETAQALVDKHVNPNVLSHFGKFASPPKARPALWTYLRGHGQSNPIGALMLGFSGAAGDKTLAQIGQSFVAGESLTAPLRTVGLVNEGEQFEQQLKRVRESIKRKFPNIPEHVLRPAAYKIMGELRPETITEQQLRKTTTPKLEMPMKSARKAGRLHRRMDPITGEPTGKTLAYKGPQRDFLENVAQMERLDEAVKAGTIKTEHAEKIRKVLGFRQPQFESAMRVSPRTGAFGLPGRLPKRLPKSLAGLLLMILSVLPAALGDRDG